MEDYSPNLSHSIKVLAWKQPAAKHQGHNCVFISANSVVFELRRPLAPTNVLQACVCMHVFAYKWPRWKQECNNMSVVLMRGREDAVVLTSACAAHSLPYHFQTLRFWSVS